MTSNSASDTEPCFADWPMAKPSEKLCRPIPVAMAIPRRRDGGRTGAVSATAIAPGPRLAPVALVRCRRHSRPT